MLGVLWSDWLTRTDSLRAYCAGAGTFTVPWACQEKRKKVVQPTFQLPIGKAYAPVEVEVRHLVGEALHLARREARAVEQHLVRRRVHRTLTHALAHQEKVVSDTKDNNNYFWDQNASKKNKTKKKKNSAYKYYKKNCCCTQKILKLSEAVTIYISNNRCTFWNPYLQ